MPRGYRLGERAAAMDATRVRILEAAIELYIERGISATTMREIGQRADVAPGTLRNHFPSREVLDAAIVERLRAEAPLPEPTIFDGTGSIGERLAILLRVAGEFFERAARIYRMWLREHMLTAPWLRTGAEYGERWDRLMRLALGSLADDQEANAVLRAVLHPAFFEAIGAGRGAPADVAALVAAVVTPWFESRAAAAASGSVLPETPGEEP